MASGFACCRHCPRQHGPSLLGRSTVLASCLLNRAKSNTPPTSLPHMCSPKNLYACPAWWNGCKYQINPLEKVQRRALRLICAVFRTSPITAMEIETSIPPIKLQAELTIRCCAIRFNKLPPTNTVIQRLPDTWRNNQQPTNPPPLPQPTNKRQPKTTIQKIAKYTSPDHERIDPYSAPPWNRTATSFPNRLTIAPCNPNTNSREAWKAHVQYIQSMKNKPDAIYIYTDGSKITNRGFTQCGVAAILYNQDTKINTTQMGLGGHTEVYDVEMAALSIRATQATEYITNHPNITHITFFTDNTAAVLAIADPRPQAAQIFATNFHNTMRPILETHNTLTIKIAWCPSHRCIKGNDRVDTLAKEATQRERQTPYSVSRSNALRRSKSTILKLWQIDWRMLNWQAMSSSERITVRHFSFIYCFLPYDI